MQNEENNSKYYYLALDGDNIGSTIELYILSNKIEHLQTFSNQYKDAMFWLESNLIKIFQGKIIFSGGDSLLAQFPIENFNLISIQELCYKFQIKSNCTISLGIGKTILQSYFALKFAKVSGKNCIKFFEDIPSNQLLN